MKKLLGLLLILCFQITAGQEFSPIPSNLKGSYRFNFEKNFYKDTMALHDDMTDLSQKIRAVKSGLAKIGEEMEVFSETLRAYDQVERQYRKLDLYFFLKYAVNMGNEEAMAISDSLRGELNTLRSLIKEKILSLPELMVDRVTASDSTFAFYVRQVRFEGPHLLSALQLQSSSFFDYVRDNSFYDRALQNMTFEKVHTEEGDIDLTNEMSTWQNHPNPFIRKEAEQKYFQGYATQREALGNGYINYIKGLNAFSKLKGFENLLEEKSFHNQIPNEVIENFFDAILKSRPAIKESGEEFAGPPNIRFSIVEATEIITQSLAVLGRKYRLELEDLLDPQNGRIDIVGGEGRIPIRGTASAYPVFPSIFYALNYEGYLIDLTLLGHEAGHAIQASLMYNHTVPMVYARGPAYFTESFGNFNELLVFDHLFHTERDVNRKKVYHEQLRERLQVLHGSAEEAYIEYYLLKGIIEGEIRNTDDLDATTYELGLKINPDLYKKDAFRKGFWMLLDSSFREPYHNMHDMIASALAVQYYTLSKSDNPKFVSDYLTILQNGYQDIPANILKTLNIDITDKRFIEGVLDLLQKDPETWGKQP